MSDENLDIPTSEERNRTKGLPPEGDPSLGRYLYDKFLIAKRDKERKDFPRKWMRNHELKRGKHFKKNAYMTDPAGGASKYPLIPVNLFFKVVSTTKANLTDNKPRFEIVPHEQGLEGQVPIMNSAANMWWKRTRQQALLGDSIENSETYGTTIEKSLFNPSLEGGMGDAETLVSDPFKFFPWPGIREVQKMPRFFDVEVMELEEIIRLWPETGHMVKAEKEWSKITGAEREIHKGGSLSSTSTEGNLPRNYVEGEPGGSEEIQRAMVIECWMKDYTMVPDMQPVPLTDLQGNQIIDELGQPVTEMQQVGEKAKYPGFIRVVHFANDGKVILDDIPNPSINPNLPEEITSQTYLWDKYPYAVSYANADTTNFFGYSTIEQLEIMVREINKKISQIAAYIDKTVRPPLINPKNSGIDDHKVNNLPGQVWRPTNHVVAQSLRYMQVPPLPSDFYKYLELLLRLVDIISGIHDVTEGRKPTGIAAASAIIALQEKAETLFREKIRNLDMLIEQRGRMWISHMQNWYTEERKLRLSGRDAELMGQSIVGFRGSEIQGEFSFEVVTGSTMPKSQFVQREQSLQLFQNQAIDQKALLDAFDYPNADEIIRRMQMGPLGMLLEKLQIAGIPPEILQSIQFVASLPDEKFEELFLQPQEGEQNANV